MDVTNFYRWVGDSDLACVLVMYLEIREFWLNQYHVSDVVSKDFTFGLCFLVCVSLTVFGRIFMVLYLLCLIIFIDLFFVDVRFS